MNEVNLSHWNKIGNLFTITDYNVSWQSLRCALIELWSRLSQTLSTSGLRICLVGYQTLYPQICEWEFTIPGQSAKHCRSKPTLRLQLSVSEPWIQKRTGKNNFVSHYFAWWNCPDQVLTEYLRLGCSFSSNVCYVDFFARFVCRVYF